MNSDFNRVAGGRVRKGTKLRIWLFVDEGDTRIDPPHVFEGKVADIDDDFLWLLEKHAGRAVEQEYVLRSGFYGAHGDLSGLIDLADAGNAEIAILR